MNRLSAKGDIRHEGVTWEFAPEDTCRDGLLDDVPEAERPTVFDVHWRCSGSDGRIVRIFPPRGEDWRDWQGRPRNGWWVTVHREPYVLPYRWQELHPGTGELAVLDLGNHFLEMP